MVKLNLIEVHKAIQGEGELMGVPHILVRVTGCNMRCSFSETICDTPYCVAPDTSVLMADRTNKPIKDIVVGDYIMGYDAVRGVLVPAMVHHTRVSKNNKECVKTYLQGKTIITTKDHNFYTSYSDKWSSDKSYKEIGSVSGKRAVWISNIPDKPFISETTEIFTTGGLSSLFYSDNFVAPRIRRKQFSVFNKKSKCGKFCMFSKGIPEVTSVETLPDVCDITTETNNFIANGFLVHNSSWSPEREDFTDEWLEEFYESHPQIKHTMITGGEPFMDINQLNILLRIAKQFNHFVTIETNGSFPFKLGGVDLLSISPKLEFSIPEPGIYTAGESIVEISQSKSDRHREISLNMVNTVGRLIENYGENRVYLKFVYTSREFLHEIMNFIYKVYFPRERVYLMPEGVTNEQLQKRRAEIFEVCMNEGFRYSDRLHIITYGNSRGT